MLKLQAIHYAHLELVIQNVNQLHGCVQMYVLQKRVLHAYNNAFI